MHLTMEYTRAVQADRLREAMAYRLAAEARRSRPGRGWGARALVRTQPRISGLEPMFLGDDLWFGMMPNSVKGRDLRRDGRFALHNAPPTRTWPTGT